MSDLIAAISSGGMGVETDKVSVQPTSSRITPEVKPEQEIKEMAPEDIKSVVDEVNAFVQNMQRNLSFTVDEELGQAIISVKDKETDEVIRQIPSEELVVLRKKMDDVTGILFETKV